MKTQQELAAAQERFAQDLRVVLSNVEQMLLAKNRKYGDAALAPLRILSKSSPSEQIRIRMDDKLSRLMSGQNDEDEDVMKDLLGYLLLDQIAKYREQTGLMQSEIGLSLTR